MKIPTTPSGKVHRTFRKMTELACERKANSEPKSHVTITPLQVGDERHTASTDLPLDVAAENGHTATDKSVYTSLVVRLALTAFRYGRSLVHFDAAAEARLRMKIDMFIIPTIALLLHRPSKYW